MSKKTINHPTALPQEANEKEQVLESLTTMEGRRIFYGMFEEKLMKLRRAVKRGAGAKVRKGIERAIKDMRETAERMRERSVEAGRTIEEARQKYQELLEEIDADQLRQSS